nr:protein asteroid homolog 1 [Ciona intestinalis]|eukprot:XP_018670588.1 protein asteroid homolog 1 [Ciona intestinalis]
MMGVVGLTSFINENKRLFLTRTSVARQRMVVDGYGFLHYVYFENNLDVRCGGDYKQLHDLFEQFFRNLKQCSVDTIVIFDGDSDEDKLQTRISRMEESIKRMKQIWAGETSAKLLPLLSTDVMRQALIELNVPYYFTKGDADITIVSIANYLNASVLANDSDFYVLGVNKGYFPLNLFHWKQVQRRGDHSFVTGYAYYQRTMTSQYRVTDRVLSFLPVLTGCDWVSRDLFASFVNALCEKQTRNNRRNSLNRRKIDVILRWLSRHKRDDAIKDELLATFKESKRSMTSQEIESCLRHYREFPDPTPIFNFLQRHNMSDMFESKPPHQTEMENASDVTCQSIPEQFIRLGKLPSNLCDVMNGTKTIVLLLIVTSDPSKPSPHTRCRSLRQTIYRLLAMHSSDNGNCDVTEYDRSIKNKYRDVTPISLPAPCDCNDGYRNPILTSWFECNKFEGHQVTARKDYLLCCLLGCQQQHPQRHLAFNDFISHIARDPELTRLPLIVATTSYWIHHTQPPRALVVSVLISLSTHDVARDLHHDLEATFDPSPSHSATEWLCCLKSSLVLNSALCFPLPEPELSFIDCRWILGVYDVIMTWKPDDVINKVTDCMSRFGKEKDLFLLLYNAIYG